MPYTLLYNENHDIVELRFRDSATFKDHLDSRQEVIKLCIEKCTSKILVHLNNLDTKGSVSKKEQFEFAKSWDGNISNKLHFAVVMPEDYDSKNEFYFIVHMSKINGIIMKEFYNEELAIKWLNSLK